MLIELHMLQSFAPSNLNRDDTNNPKDCEFGGVRRARISSQCIKRGIRTSPVFRRSVQVEPGVRTRLLARALTDALTAAGKPKDEGEKVSRAIAAAFTSKKGRMDRDDPTRTSVAVYLSRSDIEWLMAEAISRWEPLVACLAASADPPRQQQGDKPTRRRARRPSSAVEALVEDLVERTAGRTDAPDIALFGRMLADHPKTNVDAACQVAHAISTHRVAMEMDWWTAVDDLQPEGEAGAGMMGFAAFDSACFYRYACIHWPQLVATLQDGDLARRTVEAFLRASIAAVPSGKQNSFAAHNPPSLALGVVRRNGFAWSLANAFERPVPMDREGGYVRPSARALDAYWGRLCRIYGTESLAAVAVLAVDDGLELANLAAYRADCLEPWLQSLLAALPTGEGER